MKRLLLFVFLLAFSGKVFAGKVVCTLGNDTIYWFPYPRSQLTTQELHRTIKLMAERFRRKYGPIKQHRMDLFRTGMMSDDVETMTWEKIARHILWMEEWIDEAGLAEKYIGVIGLQQAALLRVAYGLKDKEKVYRDIPGDVWFLTLKMIADKDGFIKTWWIVLDDIFTDGVLATRMDQMKRIGLKVRVRPPKSYFFPQYWMLLRGVINMDPDDLEKAIGSFPDIPFCHEEP